MQAKMLNESFWVKETQADVLFSHYEKLLKDSGFTIVESSNKMFYPHGFTALFLLSESHLAIHSFPEHGRSYIELSSCIDGPYQRFVANDTMERYQA